jgi:phage gpG-like protein
MATIHQDQAGIVVDATKALKKVDLLKAGLTPKDILDTVGQRILRDTGKLLEGAGSAPGGRPWQVMAPMTLRMRPLRKSTHHFSSPYQTLLQQSMNAAVSGSQVEVGTNARYAKDHHFGAGRIPARPLLPTTSYAGEAARQTVQAIVNQLVATVGRG